MQAASSSDYLSAIHALGPLLAANFEEIEQRRELPPAVVTALTELNLFRLLVPRELGGGEVAPVTLIETIEAIARHDASTAWCVGQNAVSAMLAAYLPLEQAQQIFGQPSGVVAWGPPSAGEARAVDGGYVLNGRFNFASGSRHANWLGAHVPVIEKDGSKRLGSEGTPVTYTLLFPKSDAQVVDTWHVMGLRGTGSDSYAVSDLFVPAKFALRRDVDTRPARGGKLYAFGPSSLYAASFSGVALGIARTTLDAFMEIARDKTPRGAKRRLNENNLIQFQVGQAEARLRSARMFVIGSYEKAWARATVEQGLNVDTQVNLRLATTWAIREAATVVSTIYQAAGGTAVFTANPFERRFRDVHTVTQQIQGHESNFEAVGQVLLGAVPERRMFTF
jgi:alkylation response protein AidB-like acyl-CoA dehydrogenase